jgi:hypothetical protein
MQQALGIEAKDVFAIKFHGPFKRTVQQMNLGERKRLERGRNRRWQVSRIIPMERSKGHDSLQH